MGQSKGGGYTQKTTVTPGQRSFLDQMLAQANPMMQQAAQGYAQFLPGGGGGQALMNQANQNFQQQTLPSIMGAMGTDNKGSSALNQALGAAGSNMNVDLQALLSQLQMGAAQGMGNLGMGQAGMGMTPQFAYMQRQMPFWQSLLLGGVGAGGQAAGGWLGRK